MKASLHLMIYLDSFGHISYPLSFLMFSSMDHKPEMKWTELEIEMTFPFGDNGP